MAWPGARLFYTSCMWARGMGRVCDREQGLKRDGEEGSLLVGCMKRAVGVTSFTTINVVSNCMRILWLSSTLFLILLL